MPHLEGVFFVHSHCEPFLFHPFLLLMSLIHLFHLWLYPVYVTHLHVYAMDAKKKKRKT